MAPATKHFRKRDAILDFLRQTKSHPGAEAIYTQLKHQIPDLAMGTVYRNLHLFKQQGLIISVATVDGVERFDGNTSPHVHFICTECDAVMDLEDLIIPESLTQAAEHSSGGRADACHLSFTGVCRHCLSKKETA